MFKLHARSFQMGSPDAHIQTESRTCELPAVWTWEYEAATHEFWDQPEAIALPVVRRDGRSTRQISTPDFLLIRDDFVGWIECKPRRWIADRIAKGDPNYAVDGDGRFRHLPGERFAAGWGMSFAIRLSEDSSWILVDNLNVLADFLLDVPIEIPPDIVARVNQVLASRSWVTLKELCCTDGVTVDHLLTLVAQRRVYVDVARDRLAEPERAWVYRDAEMMNAHRAFLGSRAATGRPDLSVVDLTPGAQLTWDGKLWTVANAGESKYFLVGEEGRHAEMARDDIQQLVGRGVIVAGPLAPDARAERCARRLEQASEAQRLTAAKHYRALVPPNDGNDLGIVVPSRTLRYWKRRYRLGEELYGNGFVGLLPDVHRRGNRNRRLPPATLEVIDEVLRTKYLTHEAPTLAIAYGVARVRCIDAGIAVPSEATFSRECKRRYSQLEQICARQGAKAAYQVEPWCWDLEENSPVHGNRPFHVGHLDHTVADIQLHDDRFNRKTRKCWASVMLDANSREVLAEVFTFDPPSYRTNMMLIRECVRRHGRVPAILVVDWGADFHSTYFEVLTAFLGVEVRHRPKSAPRHGTLIERVFKRITEEYVGSLAGNNKPLQAPRSMSPSHDPRKRALWTLAAFSERSRNYLREVYSNQVHGTLGVSPAQAMAHGLTMLGERIHRRIVFDEAFRMLCLPSTRTRTARVQKGGVMKINNIPYHASELLKPAMVGSDFEVRYEPFNMGLAYAFVEGRWRELRSSFYTVFSRYSEREIEEASALLRERTGSIYKNRQINIESLARFLMDAEAEEAPSNAPSQPPADLFADLPAVPLGEFS